MTLDVLHDVVNDAELSQKTNNYAKIANLKSATMGKLINITPGSRLLISGLAGLASRTYVESLGKPHLSTIVLKALPSKLDIKRHHLVFCSY